jgi:hypothetical protein
MARTTVLSVRSALVLGVDWESGRIKIVMTELVTLQARSSDRLEQNCIND